MDIIESITVLAVTGRRQTHLTRVGLGVGIKDLKHSLLLANVRRGGVCVRVLARSNLPSKSVIQSFVFLPSFQMTVITVNV